MLGKLDAQSLCENVTDEIYSKDAQATAQYWKSYLCAGQMIDRFEQLTLSSQYQDSMAKVSKIL